MGKIHIFATYKCSHHLTTQDSCGFGYVWTKNAVSGKYSTMSFKVIIIIFSPTKDIHFRSLFQELVHYEVPSQTYRSFQKIIRNHNYNLLFADKNNDIVCFCNTLKFVH